MRNGVAAAVLVLASLSPGPVLGQSPAPTSPPAHEFGRVPFEAGLRDRYGASAINAVAAGPKGIVAVGKAPAGAAAWYSVDGLKWTRATPPRSWTKAGQYGWFPDLEAVVATGSGFVAVGMEHDGPKRFGRNIGSVWTSKDGLKWRRSARGVGPRLTHVTEHRGRLYATSGYVHRRAEPGIWMSADGVEWTLVHEGAGGPIASDGSRIVAGNVDAMVYSDDGLVWNSATVDPARGESDEIYDIAATERGFVAVGQRGDRAATWLSDDGRSWTGTPTTIPTKQYIMVFTAVASQPDGRLIATASDDQGSGYIYVSSDSLGWELVQQSPPTDDDADWSLQDIAMVGDRTLVVGHHPDKPRPWSAAVWTDPAPATAAREGREVTTCPSGRPTLMLLLSMAPASRLSCFGSRELTFRAFLGRHQEFGDLEYFPRPQWLTAGTSGAHALPIKVSKPSTLELVLHVPRNQHLRQDARRRFGRWATVSGHFDDRAAAKCSQGWRKRCREAFVVTSVR